MLVFDDERKLVWRKTYRRRINFMNVSKKINGNWCGVKLIEGESIS